MNEPNETAAERLETLGVPSADVAAVAQAAIANWTQLAGAVQRMNETVPGFEQRAPAMAQAIEQTPGLRDLIAARPDVGLRVALSLAEGQPSPGAAPTPSRPAWDGDQVGDVETMRQRMHENDNRLTRENYARARLREVIDPRFYDPSRSWDRT